MGLAPWLCPGARRQGEALKNERLRIIFEIENSIISSFNYGAVGIYILANLLTNGIYVGQSWTNLKVRVNDHAHKLTSIKGHDIRLMQEDFDLLQANQDYGYKAFKAFAFLDYYTFFEISLEEEEILNKKLDILEKNLINLFPTFGYKIYNTGPARLSTLPKDTNISSVPITQIIVPKNAKPVVSTKTKKFYISAKKVERDNDFQKSEIYKKLNDSKTREYRLASKEEIKKKAYLSKFDYLFDEKPGYSTFKIPLIVNNQYFENFYKVSQAYNITPKSI